MPTQVQGPWRAPRPRAAGRITPGPNAEVRGAYPLGRRTQLPEDKPWQRIPPGAPTPYLTEWAVMWVLSEYGVGPQRHKLKLGIDYYYQRALPAPGLFAKKPFTRADFILPGYGKALRGLVLNPISVLTHPTPWLDLRQRDVLARGGWQEIFLDQGPLMRDPVLVVNEALRGIDRSARGMRIW